MSNTNRARTVSPVEMFNKQPSVSAQICQKSSETEQSDMLPQLMSKSWISPSYDIVVASYDIVVASYDIVVAS